ILDTMQLVGFRLGLFTPPGSNAVVGLYDDNGGLPGKLLATSGPVPIGHLGGCAGENVRSLQNPMLVRGQQLWIGVKFDQKTQVTGFQGGVPGIQYNEPFANPLRDPAPLLGLAQVPSISLVVLGK